MISPFYGQENRNLGKLSECSKPHLVGAEAMMHTLDFRLQSVNPHPDLRDMVP